MFTAGAKSLLVSPGDARRAVRSLAVRSGSLAHLMMSPLSGGSAPGSPYTASSVSAHGTASVNGPPESLPEDQPPSPEPATWFELLEHAIHTTDDATTAPAQARRRTRMG
jgi:hypothetical protein